MEKLETRRLLIEELRLEDASFILELLNDPDFIDQIADRGVRNLEDARRFLRDGPLASYREHGFGMFAVRGRQTGESLGLCGLVRRPELETVDLGYAFLPSARGQGFALEAARRVLRFAHEDLDFKHLLAIVNPGNLPSRTLLEKLGMQYQKMIQLGPEQARLCQYVWTAKPCAPPAV